MKQGNIVDYHGTRLYAIRYVTEKKSWIGEVLGVGQGWSRQSEPEALVGYTSQFTDQYLWFPECSPIIDEAQESNYQIF